jgi:hypothetical protein
MGVWCGGEDLARAHFRSGSSAKNFKVLRRVSAVAKCVGLQVAAASVVCNEFNTYSSTRFYETGMDDFGLLKNIFTVLYGG